MKWHEEVLDRAALAAAARLAPLLNGEFYLAGGTGLALREGHRVSLDLDLFSQTQVLDGQRRDRLVEALRRGGGVEVRESRDGTLHLVLNGTAVSLFHYAYPLLNPSEPWRGIPVASIEDIAAMKVSAVLGRGSKKDFLDVRRICRKQGLSYALEAARRRFPPDASFLTQALRALVYFEDAETEPMPRMLERVDWSDVRAYFEREVPRLARKRLL